MQTKYYSAAQMQEQHAELFDELGIQLPLINEGRQVPLNLYSVLLNAPHVAAAFLRYWKNIKSSLSLAADMQELIILRCAVYYRNSYVWGHHAAIAKKIGIPAQDIDNISKPLSSASWPQETAVLLNVVDEILHSGNVSDSVKDHFLQYWSIDIMVELICVVATFVNVCSLNNIFKTPLEAAFKTENKLPW